MDKKTVIRKKRMMTAGNIAALILLGIVMQIGGAYLVNAAVIIMENTPAAGQYSSYMEVIRSLDTRHIMQAVIVMPIIEELVFRLIFLRAGRMLLPIWAANIVQAILFGVYHTVTIQRIYGFVLGLMIGCVFCYCPIIYKSRGENPQLLNLPDSLFGYALTVVLHVTINAAGIFLAPLLPADLPTAMQVLIGTIFMMLAAGSCLKLYMLKKRITDVDAGSTSEADKLRV